MPDQVRQDGFLTFYAIVRFSNEDRFFYAGTIIVKPFNSQPNLVHRPIFWF